MANHVSTTYISFFTKEYWEKRNNEDYNEGKFNAMYSQSPGRMTPEQIKAHGHDIARSRMWSQYIETKYNSLWTNEVGMANSVAHQFAEAILGKYPNLHVSVTEGKVKKYGDRKLIFPKIIISNDKNNSGMEITPTLSDKDNNYFSVYITIHNNGENYSEDFKLDDIQTMTQIDRFVSYIQTNIMPDFGVDKVYNWCENQYILRLNNSYKIELYDTEMVNLYHTLAKAMNKEYGTNFPYSETIIKKLYKHPTFGNRQYTGQFFLSNIYSNHAVLKYSYFYEDDKTKEPTFQCFATYGEWDKDKLIHLLATLEPYVKNDYFYHTSLKTLCKKYDDYDRIGIRYSDRPKYLDVLLWED